MDSSVDPPPPNITGRSKQSYLRCPMTLCPFLCRKYHIYKIHLEEVHWCSGCLKHFADRHGHPCNQSGAGPLTDIHSDVFKEHSRAHKGAVRSYIHFFDGETFEMSQSTENGVSLSKAFVRYQPPTHNLIQQALAVFGNLKVTLKLAVIMANRNFGPEGSEEVEQIAYFSNSYPNEISAVELIDDVILACFDDIKSQIEIFITLGSGHRVKNLISLEVKMYEFLPYHHARAKGWLRMPFLRRGVVNFKLDKDCFKVCVVAGLNWKQMSKEMTKEEMLWPNNWKPLFQNYDFSDIRSAVSVYADIPKFERANKVSINVFSHKGEQVINLRKSPKAYKQVVNLFMIHETSPDRGVPPRFHFALIKDLNLFLSKSRTHKKFYCIHCLRGFSRERDMFRHAGKCKDPYDSKDFVRHIYPNVGDTLKFRRPQMCLPFPSIIFYDWETYAVNRDDYFGPKTKVINELVPASFSMILVTNKGAGPRVEKIKYYAGGDCVDIFYQTAFKWSQEVLTTIRTVNNNARPTSEQLAQHIAATNCELCLKPFSKPEDVTKKLLTESEARARQKHFHHNHITSEFQFSLCAACNLQIRFKNEVPLYAHNATNFDIKILTKGLHSRWFDKSDVSILGKSTEKFIEMRITSNSLKIPDMFNPNYPKELQSIDRDFQVKLRFGDSCLFLLAPLDRLVQGLERDDELTKFQLVKDSFPSMVGREATIEDMQFFLRKMEFPYAYLNSPASIQPNHPLPDRSWYKNILKGTTISDEDWELMQTICQRFGISDFPSLLKCYNILDTALLACVFENYRQKCQKNYVLDPVHSPTISSYSWNCWLYLTRAEVELMSCPKMLAMVQENIRGGFCFATKKIIAANAERTPVGLNPNKPRSHIVYLDLNALYGHALKRKFPTGNYRFLSESEINSIDWADDELGSNGWGFILEVDLEYHHSAHARTKDLPFCPLKRPVKLAELSKGQQERLQKLGPAGKSFLSQPKLILDCADKFNYTVHYKTLRFYLQNGLRLRKVHRAFTFTETECFRSYVEMNIELRKNATDKSEQESVKLNSNSLYGKSIENNLDHFNIKVCGSRERALEYINCSRLRDILILSDDLSLVFLTPAKIRRDKIIQTGFTVLEYAKEIFYRGYLEHLVPMFHGRATLSYSDTDSCILHIEDPENTLLDDLFAGREHLDFSKLSPDCDLLQKYPELINYNKGVSGKWKIEYLDVLKAAFLKPKMYSMVLFNDLHFFRAKGMTAESMKEVVHNDYERTIKESCRTTLPVKMIRSINHRLYTLEIQKSALHDADVSRCYPKRNDINFSLPFYHHQLYGCTCTDDSPIDSDETIWESD